jgi:hypothetical protein
MSEPWYDVVEATVPLTQGDLIADCPLLGWKETQPGGLTPGDPADLAQLAHAFLRDVVVMSQACDLEYNKVRNVVLCPTLPLSDYKRVWEADQAARNQNPTAKAWRKVCDETLAGAVWNQSMLSGFDHPSVRTEVRVVFFDEVYTLPRWFLESVLANRARPRLRLRPPYREHLSQSLARFFMRVGLPQPITIP